MRYSIVLASLFASVVRAEPTISDSISSGAEYLNDLVAKLPDSHLLEAITDEAKQAWNDLVATGQDIERDFEQFMSQFVSDKEPIKFLDSDQDWEYFEDSDTWTHSLRIKSPRELGIDTVKQYAGYADLKDENKHLFFWFFEARNGNKDAPTILWLNGEPACSSLVGMFTEVGPALLKDNAKPVHNAYSWNNEANIIFLDQPVNTGFSHSNTTVTDSLSAAKDVEAFLSLFFKRFPKYARGGLHLAGESFSAGHILPALGAQLVNHYHNFQLKSVVLGNGHVDPSHQIRTRYPMACGHGEVPAVLDNKQCESLKADLPRCNNLLETCADSESQWLCAIASFYCERITRSPLEENGLNPFDLRKKCTGKNGHCYEEFEYVSEYLNNVDVLNALGVDRTFGLCDASSTSGFKTSGDWALASTGSMRTLLQSNVTVLVYAGDKDYLNNWIGQDLWTRRLDWWGKSKFENTQLVPWLYKGTGRQLGELRSYGPLSFLRVFDSGSLVPHDQPRIAAEMIVSWINGKLNGQKQDLLVQSD